MRWGYVHVGISLLSLYPPLSSLLFLPALSSHQPRLESLFTDYSLQLQSWPNEFGTLAFVLASFTCKLRRKPTIFTLIEIALERFFSPASPKQRWRPLTVEYLWHIHDSWNQHCPGGREDDGDWNAHFLGKWGSGPDVLARIVDSEQSLVCTKIRWCERSLLRMSSSHTHDGSLLVCCSLQNRRNFLRL